MTARRELASLPLRDRVAAVIDATELGQDGFAERIGASRETVNRWVNGHWKPGRSYRQKLAEIATEAFGEPLTADLFRNEGSQPLLLEEVLRSLADATTELIGLLAEQRQIVAQLQRIADVLEPLADGGNSGPTDR